MNSTAFKYFFFRFIISFIVIIDLENQQKLSKIIILSRIIHVYINSRLLQHITFVPSSVLGKRCVESCKFRRSMVGGMGPHAGAGARGGCYTKHMGM